MDVVDKKIIGLLAADARRSLADIGAAVDLSPSAVNERIRRLVASGAIRRFTVDADHQALGFDVLAFVWVALAADANEEEFRSFVAAHPVVCECHHVHRRLVLSGQSPSSRARGYRSISFRIEAPPFPRPQ